MDYDGHKHFGEMKFSKLVHLLWDAAEVCDVCKFEIQTWTEISWLKYIVTMVTQSALAHGFCSLIQFLIWSWLFKFFPERCGHWAVGCIKSFKVVESWWSSSWEDFLSWFLQNSDVFLFTLTLSIEHYCNSLLFIAFSINKLKACTLKEVHSTVMIKCIKCRVGLFNLHSAGI